MPSQENEKSPPGLRRREFLQYVGLGSAALGLSTAGIAGLTSPATPREEEVIAHYPGATYFAGPWQLYLDEGNLGKRQEWYRQPPSRSAKGYEVRVPGCWQEYVPGLAGGIGWYFKEFALPAELKGQVLRLKFWAVDYFTEVWLNGEKLGEHEGGFTPFELNMTKAARLAEQNRLAVRVVDPPRPLNQSLMGLPGWEGKTDGVVDGYTFKEIPMGHQSWQEGFNFGGIWQPVELLASPSVYISDVFIEPKWRDGSIEAHVEVSSHNPGSVLRRLRVAVSPWKETGRIAGQSEKDERFPPGGKKQVDVHVDLRDPRAWSPEDPYLYLAEVTLEGDGGVQDRTTARFGLREFTVKDGYFHLNGKRIFVKSGHHQGTYPTTLESPPTREFAYKEVRIFKEAGFNFCRLWVKPAPPEFLDAADELGLMLQEEPPLSTMEDSPLMLERSVREVREMVLRDRNRPSIVLWNMINECDQPMKYVRQQCEVARRLDPTRLITESAGGPSHYYVPYSMEGVSYLDEHPYCGAPIADDVWDYNRTRGVAGQLCFFSEYGYGGMNDLDSVLEKYGPSPKNYMEDYAGHALLRERREKAWADSNLLQKAFRDPGSWREACQTVQADVVRLHTEAMRCNPCMAGYNYVQVFDSNAIEIDGLVDFWRDKRKKAFYAMQEANKPLILVVRCTPMNARAGDEVGVSVTLVNEEQVSGGKRLTVSMRAPSGGELLSRDAVIEAKPWISTVFEETVKLQDAPGQYTIEATLWHGSRPLVIKQEFCTVFSDLQWPAAPLFVLDPEQRLEPYLAKRRIACQKLGAPIQTPAIILVTPTTSLWRRPEDYVQLIRLFTWVERGCTAIFLEVPLDGPSLLTSAPIFMESFLSPFALANITPFDRVSSVDETWAGQRVGAYAWGLTDYAAGVPIPKHAIFAGTPQDGIMGREFANVVPVKKILTDWNTSEDTGTTVQIHSSSSASALGKGRIIISSLNLLPNLDEDALAEKLLHNLVSYAQETLPQNLELEDAEMTERLKFQLASYQDCVTKYLAKKRGT